MKFETILRAWFTYCDSVLNPDEENKEWTVTFAEELAGRDAVRPPKPYVTLKVISGPNKIAIDDNLENVGDEFNRIGRRRYTLSIKSYGEKYIEGLELIRDFLEEPDFYDQLKDDAKISASTRNAITDISGRLETGFERRASLDIIFDSSNNRITAIEPIEKVELGGTFKSGDKENETNLPIIE